MRTSILFLILSLAVSLLLSCSSVPDGELQDGISQKLQAAGINNISVAVKKGAVTLSGQVPDNKTYYQAETIAKSVEGVRSVQLSMTFVQPTPEPTIAAEVAVEPPSLYEEAQLEAERYWNRFIFHCGESDFIYYHRPADRYYSEPLHAYREFRNLAISVEGEVASPGSEADRLNEQYAPSGREWAGRTFLTATVGRIFLSQDTPDAFTSKGWNKWGEISEPLYKVGLSKINGKWSVDEGQGASRFESEYFKIAKCQHIPRPDGSGHEAASENNPAGDSIRYGKVILLSAKKMWMDTGIFVRQGQSLSITASGKWSNSGNEVFVGADGFNNGWPGIIVESANIAQLIGKIGTRIFPIGASYSASSQSSGRLFLTINDIPGKFDDNYGSLKVSVRIE